MKHLFTKLEKFHFLFFMALGLFVKIHEAGSQALRTPPGYTDFIG